MGLHRNARLGLAGRRALVADVQSGLSCREAARRRGVSPTTACKWWRRWLEATPGQQATLRCLEDRSSRPHRSPRFLSQAEQARICATRRRSGWGPRLIAGETGHPHATVWRALRRAGISRPPRPRREQPRLYEWPCPGDLLHIDGKRFVRFSRPGHAVTGDRHRTSREKRMRIGYEWVHSIVDDHSRYAYSELHADERADTVTAFVERALEHFSELGIEPKRSAAGRRSAVSTTSRGRTSRAGLDLVPRVCKPSDGLEPSTASLPSSNEAGTAGKSGKPRARKSRKKKETADDD